jgi:hypothetical protein
MRIERQFGAVGCRQREQNMRIPPRDVTDDTFRLDRSSRIEIRYDAMMSECRRSGGYQ